MLRCLSLSLHALTILRSGLSESPLKPRLFQWLEIDEVKPRGWLLVQERIQADTLGGHLQDFLLNGSQWMGGVAPLEGPHSLETVPYWLYGLVPLASQLEDDKLMAVVRSYLSTILARQGADGWMGPWNESAVDASRDPGPRYRLLSVLAEYADLTKDFNVISSMHRLMVRILSELQSLTVDDLKYKFSWAHARWHELVDNAQYLIDKDPDNKFGDRAALLEVMSVVKTKGLDWDQWYKGRLCANASDTFCFPCRDTKSKQCQFAAAQYFCEHGVNVPQSLKLWSLDWRLTGNPQAAADAQSAIMRLDYCHGQPGGVFSAHEVIDGIEPNRGTETCSVVEAMNSYAELFATFGTIGHLDRVEAAAFNRLPAPYFNGSMWAMQYFHQTSSTNFCNAYGLPFECCPSNGNQGWPRFTAHMYAKHQSGIAAVLYAPSTMQTVLLENDHSNHVNITLDTSYPFGETLTFTIVTERPFPFYLRIPGWAKGASVALNEDSPIGVDGGTLHRVNLLVGRSTVQLLLPMHVRVLSEPGGGVTIHAGALWFALDLAPNEVKGSECYYPPEGCFYQLTSKVENWRQALVLDTRDPDGGGLYVEHFNTTGPPFSSVSVPVRIRANAVAIPAELWQTVNCTSMEAGCRECVGSVPTSIPSTGVASAVTLLPFGATDVRIGVLPALWRDLDPSEQLVV